MDGDRAEQLRGQIAQCKRLMETVWDEKALQVRVVQFSWRGDRTVALARQA